MLARLGDLSSETPGQSKESSACTLTQDKVLKVQKDQPKGKESQVSKSHTPQLPPDTSVQGREQGQKAKVKCLNPRRRLALCLGPPGPSGRTSIQGGGGHYQECRPQH